MTRIDRYIFHQLLTATIFVAVTLTCVVWLTQSLRFIEMIVNRGLSISLFVYFTLLLLPNFLSICLPVALLVAVLFIYSRLSTDSELVVLRAGGFSHYRLARPAITLALLTTMVCYTLTVYFIPTSYRSFKDMQLALRNSFPVVMLQEGVFNTVVKGITVHVRQRTDDGELRGIMVHDARNPKRPVTMMAERGSIVDGANGPRVVMINGNRQETNEKDGRLSLLYFDRYSFDLGAIAPTQGTRRREPRERFLPQLFSPPAIDYQQHNKLLMEGHYRLASPMLPVAFAFVALAFMLGGDFSRRGQLLRVLGAVGTVLLMEAAQLSIKNLGERLPTLAPLMYIAALVPMAAGAIALGGRWGIRRRRAALAPPGQA
ncbi:MAG: LPS export ABC transporter permease LptF [Alphaproteobacteria bacterium]